MIPGSHAALSLAPEEDPVPRLERFLAAHPDVPVLLMGAFPKAWVGGQKIEHPTLRGLLDGLEEICGPDPQARHAGGSQ